MQKLLIVSTVGETVRSEIIGWTFEDGDEVRKAAASNGHDPAIFPIWQVSSKAYQYPKTVLNALGDGWRLLAPPQPTQDGSFYEWWLVQG